MQRLKTWLLLSALLVQKKRNCWVKSQSSSTLSKVFVTSVIFPSIPTSFSPQKSLFCCTKGLMALLPVQCQFPGKACTDIFFLEVRGHLKMRLGKMRYIFSRKPIGSRYLNTFWNLPTFTSQTSNDHSVLVWESYWSRSYHVSLLPSWTGTKKKNTPCAGILSGIPDITSPHLFKENA